MLRNDVVISDYHMVGENYHLTLASEFNNSRAEIGPNPSNV